MSTTIRLTAEVQHQILASIRAGGYAHVAAQAWGVLADVWQRWLDSGRRPGAREPYRGLYRLVQQAKAQARLKAEMAVLTKDPRFWLKNGPGKDPIDAPGWGASARLPPPEGLTAEEVSKFMDTLREALAPFPAALDALARCQGMPGMEGE